MIRSLFMLLVGAWLAQAGVFYALLTRPAAVEKADAVVVFMGADGRAREGYALARRGLAPYLILSPADVRRAAALDRKWVGRRPAFRHLIEDRAETTFQNALLTARIIREKALKSCLLVTSPYHMPRSRLLLELMLWGTDVKILPCPTAPGPFPASPMDWQKAHFKRAHNEMVEFWGSLLEAARYAVSRELPPRGAEDGAGVAFLRSVLLFQMD
ncbi:YdcF family protein [Desulfococcus multivorans]|uniref:DUF218 domain-containing protein n=1 Tax=Desulfococcus multivorans DSM 2059 TaxID=1121405 RepID=S7UPP1_DESML|nr:YdcF family protein [Desulfococcus multivorans]AOY60165.1 conserved uncharacterized protein, DUF218 [Desulfococcus multivorans]AQV02295.1 hypothetical protein B2D07_16985 [Desulfococcus multivorans]EPR34253.1 protein of unknown function DUF218 [Desulfococcus multivorans DSM 2059]SKA06086.1 DUF218 domain-containing protein [Desulfococcus multivorans DSM 2059]